MIRIFLLLLVFVIIVLGRIAVFFSFSQEFSDGEKISFTSTLLDEPVEVGRFNRITVTYGNFFSARKIYIYYPSNINLHYGEKISISGKVKIIKPKNLSNQNNRVINTKNNVAIYFPKIEPINDQNILLSVSSSIRQNTKDLYFKNLSQRSANLLLGIVLGIRGNFSQDFFQSLRNSGVMHVIAASGMNITLVSGFIFGFFGKFFTKRLNLLLTIFGTAFYILISGFQPSIVRAGIMSSLVFTGQLFGRQYTPVYGLFFTILIMIFISPQLLFDIGFFLSVFSTLGILFIKPLFSKSIFFEDITTTISAQVATIPILLFSFGQYGIISIFVNALILWTVPLLMILGGLSAIFQFIPSLSAIFLFFAAPLLWFFENIVSLFGTLPLFTIKQGPVVIFIGYYLLVLGVVWLLWERKKISKYANTTNKQINENI